MKLLERECSVLIVFVLAMAFALGGCATITRTPDGTITVKPDLDALQQELDAARQTLREHRESSIESERLQIEADQRNVDRLEGLVRDALNLKRKELSKAKK